MDQVKKSRQVLVDDRTYSVMSVRNGGMGRVWLLEQTFDSPLDPIYRRRIAVKTFDFMDDERAIEQELNIWISLDHRSVLPLKKIGRLNYRLAAIMPLLQGSLDDILETRGCLSEREASTMLMDIVDGLDYAWTRFKILHLDLKPSNVLVESRSTIQPKIADWGVSRLATVNHTMHSRNVSARSAELYDQRTAYAAGTPLFMAPERFSGNWELSPAADIYSLGLMAIQLTTGTFPFRFGQVNPLDEITNGSYLVNAIELLDNHSQQFRDFCLWCIDPRLSSRPSSYRDVAKQLKIVIQRGRQ